MSDPVSASLEPRTEADWGYEPHVNAFIEELHQRHRAYEELLVQRAERAEQAATEARRELLAKVEGEVEALHPDDWLRVAGIEYVAVSAVMGVFEDERRLIEESDRADHELAVDAEVFDV